MEPHPAFGLLETDDQHDPSPAREKAISLGMRCTLSEITACLFLLLPFHGLQAEPLFDAHMHYNATDAARYSPQEIIGILESNDISQAAVTSNPPRLAMALHAEAAGRIVPLLGVYRDAGDKQEWTRDSSLPARIEAELDKPMTTVSSERLGKAERVEDARGRQAVRERVELEAKVQHAQKLESLGLLAGGIAHDFNNLLMGIIGNAELAHKAGRPESILPAIDAAIVVLERTDPGAESRAASERLFDVTLGMVDSAHERWFGNTDTQPGTAAVSAEIEIDLVWQESARPIVKANADQIGLA